MWDSFIVLTINKDDKGLVSNCMGRCRNALEAIYTYEENINGSFWKLDERLYENSMSILYERYCYAMSLIIDKFCQNHINKYGRKEAQEGCINFEVVISTCSDALFNKLLHLNGYRDGIRYYQSGHESKDYSTDKYDTYWKMNKKTMQDVIIAKESFSKLERKWEYGFSSDTNADDEDGDMQIYEKDFLHIKKIVELTDDVDINKFLNATKRTYLPIAIEAFSKNPIDGNVFETRKWWQIWK